MSDRKVTDAVKKLAGTYQADEVSLVLCTVNSVDMAGRSCHCTPVTGTAVTALPTVRLMAEVDDGMLLIPALGSTVMVGYSKKNVPYICLFSQLEAIWFVTLSGIQLQGNEYGGLVRADALVAKLNYLESAVNVLNAKVAPLTGAPPPPPLTFTQQTEIENTSVKHGS
jgi:hypothetical protein